MTRNFDISLGDIQIGTVSGINNITDPSRLSPQELTVANNIDISDVGRPSRRSGSVKKVTPAGAIHSMWGDGRECFYVESATLKRLLPDYTSTVLRSNVGDYPMSYVEVNDKYFYCNAAVIAYVSQGISYELLVPTQDHKYSLLSGQHIEYYNNRLYVARNETLWYSDAVYLEQYDKRYNFIPFDNEITMLRAVDDGMWICTGDITNKSTYFISGATREAFTLRRYAGHGCNEGTDVKIKDGYKVGNGLTGTVIMWTSDRGICIGGNSGQFINISDKKYNVPEKRYGAGLFREIDGLNQYISIIWS